jgi:hypothetical protein
MRKMPNALRSNERNAAVPSLPKIAATIASAPSRTRRRPTTNVPRP